MSFEMNLPGAKIAGGKVGTNAERLALSTSGMPVLFQFYETDTGALYLWGGDTWQLGGPPRKSYNAHTDIPRIGVQPDVSGSPLSTMFLDAGDTQAVCAALITVNAGDDVVAATRLAAAGPDVAVLTPGSTITIVSDTPITRVDIVGTGSATAGGVVISTAMTVALCLTHQDTFNFSSTDNIRTVTVTMSDTYAVGGETGSPQATIYVEGHAHA